MAAPRRERLTLAVRIVRGWRVVLYVLLFASAAVTLFGSPILEQAVREGRAPPAAMVLGPSLLLLFVALFTVYRFILVWVGRYSAGKAFVQVAILALFSTLVLPGSFGRWRTSGTVRPLDLTRHLAAEDPETRALAAELARHRDRGEAMHYVPRLIELLEDPSAEVQRRARASLGEIAGSDVGGEGPDAVARWRDWWAKRKPADR